MSESFEPLVATIDIGTTSTRVILFNRLGQEIAKHQIEYSTSAQIGDRRDSEQIISNQGIAITVNDDLVLETAKEPTLLFPQAGWVECRVESILANAIQCFACCLLSLQNFNKDRDVKYKVNSIGVANMRETTIVWSKKTGKALYNGIVWNDTRNSSIVLRIIKENSKEKLEAIRQKNGTPISTYFSATKFLWLLENVPEVADAYDNGNGDLMFGTVDTWLIYHLSKENAFVSDVTNAARTAFMDLDTKDYDDELLEFWGVDRAKIQLPKIVPSSEKYGTFKIPDLKKIGYTESDLTKEALDVLKTVEDIPICGCLGDQSASLVGQLAVKKGNAKCTYGTGAFLLYNTGDSKLISKNGALTTFGYWFPHLDESVDGEGSSHPQYALEGSIAVAGSVVQWLRDNLRLISQAQDVGPLASLVKTSGGVVFVPAFSGLFAPYWDSASRGTILGLTQYTSASHIARAALEGVCFQTRAILKAMVNDAGASAEFLDESSKITKDSPLSQLAVDGGMSKSDEVMQIQSDILGPCVTVKRSPNAECTALGAAIAAGLYLGVWSSLKEAVAAISKGNEMLTVVDGIPVENTFKATLSDAERRKEWNQWERAVERAKGWLVETEGH